MKTTFNPFLAATLAISAISASPVSAASLYWKTSTANGWSSTSWATAPGGTYDQAWVSGSDVVFEDNLGTALTITGATTQFASITANENVTLTASGTLGTGGSVAIVNVASGKTLDFAGQAVSTAAGTGFIKNGPGTWNLAGGTYTGGFTLNAGTVGVGGVNALGGGTGETLTINGGTLRSNSATARDLTNKYTGGITIGGDVTFGDAINNGLLTFSNNTELGGATRTLTVNSSVILNGVISGGVGVGIIKAGPGVLTFGGTNTYVGTTAISNGVLSIANTASIPGFSTNGSYSVASGAALAVGNAVTDGNITSMLATTNFAAGSAIGFDASVANRSYGETLADTAQGSLGLFKVGGNTLTLSGNNSYTGGTTISNATNAAGIVVAHASALGSGAVIANGSQQFNNTLSVNSGLSVSNALTLKRGLSGSGRSVLGLAASSIWAGNITLDNTSSSGFAAIVSSATTTETACIVSGNIGFSTLGAGTTVNPTLALRGTNFFGKVTGSVSLSNGFLQALDSTKWEFSNASNTWGTLDISNAGAIVTVGATNTLSSTGVVTSTSATGGTLNLNNQANTAAYSQTIAGLGGRVKVGLLTGAATLTLNTTTDQSCSGVISGEISLVKSGAAKQTLTGANTYTGSTTINGGTLELGTTGAISTGDLTISSATLDLRKGTATRLQFVDDLSLTNATLEIGLNFSVSEAAADQINAFTATVSGTNTLKLHGSLPPGSYNIISTPSPLSGTFVLDQSGVTPSGFPSTYSGAIEGNNYVLTVSGTAFPDTAYWKGDVSGTWNDASLAPNSNWQDAATGGSDTAQLPGANSSVFFSATGATNTTTTLGTDFSIYSLTFESGTSSIGGAKILNILGVNLNNFALEVLAGATTTFNTAATNYAGDAAIQTGGTLTVNGGGLGSGTGTLTVDGTLNANMDLNAGSLTGAGSISRSIAGTSVLTASGSANTTYAGSIANGAGTVSLNKTGNSTLTLSGTNSYSGGTVITQSNNATAIVIANGSALGSGPVIANGSQQFSPTLSVNDGLTVANALTLKRGLSGSGRAVLGLGAGATWSGDITLDNTSTSGFAAILTGGTDAATACIVSGNIGFSTLGSGDINNPNLALRSSNSFGKVTGSISLSTGYLQLIDSSRWEFSNPSNTWGTLDIKNAGAVATVGATNTLASGGVVFSNVGGTLLLNDQAGTTAYNQTIAGLSGDVKVGLTTGAATLTLDTAANQSSTGVISGAISLVKTGAAIQTLGGVNTYTGNTTVNNGTFILPDNAQLKFIIGANGVNNQISGSGAVELSGDFNIDLSGADLTNGNSWTLVTTGTLSEAFLSSFTVVGFTESANVHTLVDGNNTWTFTESTGVLSLAVAGGFNTWVASKGLAGGDAAFNADPDGDGLENGLEFVLGGEPNPANPGANSTALLPIMIQSGGNMTYTFKRKDISESDVVLNFQWSTDLTFPSPANDVPVGAADSTTDTITVDVTEDSPDADTDTIVITVPAAKAAGGKLFGRLKAIQTP